MSSDNVNVQYVNRNNNVLSIFQFANDNSFSHCSTSSNEIILSNQIAPFLKK